MPKAAADPARGLRQSASFQPPSPSVKTYDIEVQRLVSARHDKGAIDIGLQALVLPRKAGEDSADSTLRLPVEHARTLMLLLKERLAELDKLQPRSRRSGRC